ncbi:MAG: PilZ domain-containing protein [Pseudomonadota bacterium]
MSQDLAPESPQMTTLSIGINALGALYGSYMYFLENKGLFIPTGHPYKLGDHLQLRLQLMNQSETFDILAKVAWITPSAAQGNRSAGVGLEFVSGDVVEAVSLIEKELVNVLESSNPTHTM